MLCFDAHTVTTILQCALPPIKRLVINNYMISEAENDSLPILLHCRSSATLYNQTPTQMYPPYQPKYPLILRNSGNVVVDAGRCKMAAVYRPSRVSTSSRFLQMHFP